MLSTEVSRLAALLLLLLAMAEALVLAVAAGAVIAVVIRTLAGWLQSLASGRIQPPGSERQQRGTLRTETMQEADAWPKKSSSSMTRSRS